MYFEQGFRDELSKIASKGSALRKALKVGAGLAAAGGLGGGAAYAAQDPRVQARIKQGKAQAMETLRDLRSRAQSGKAQAMETLRDLRSRAASEADRLGSRIESGKAQAIETLRELRAKAADKLNPSVRQNLEQAGKNLSASQLKGKGLSEALKASQLKGAGLHKALKESQLKARQLKGSLLQKNAPSSSSGALKSMLQDYSDAFRKGMSRLPGQRYLDK